MLRRLVVYLRRNALASVALFVALGGTSYAAVHLAPGSVTARAIAPGAVTHTKLAPNSVSSMNVAKGTLAASDFKRGTLSGMITNLLKRGAAGTDGALGTAGQAGRPGATGPVGPVGKAGANGSDAIVSRVRGGGVVSAPHGANTAVPLASNTWSQAAGELDLVVGNVTLTTPSSCTGSPGNSLIVSVDGIPATFAVAPYAPASTDITMPIVVTSLMEPTDTTNHTVTASLANSCTKSGEDFTVKDTKLDVVSFR